jgi:hypothetical protein
MSKFGSVFLNQAVGTPTKIQLPQGKKRIRIVGHLVVSTRSGELTVSLGPDMTFPKSSSLARAFRNKTVATPTEALVVLTSGNSQAIGVDYAVSEIVAGRASAHAGAPSATLTKAGNVVDIPFLLNANGDPYAVAPGLRFYGQVSLAVTDVTLEVYVQTERYDVLVDMDGYVTDLPYVWVLADAAMSDTVRLEWEML